MTFTDKVRSMSAKEIIMAMVNGLRKRHTEIDMNDWGRINDQGTCFGCAATNCIIEIDGTKDNLFNYSESKTRLFFENIVGDFEDAIDSLRRGNIEWYNGYATVGHFAQISNPNSIELPILTDEYTEADLLIYEQLANDQI